MLSDLPPTRPHFIRHRPREMSPHSCSALIAFCPSAPALRSPLTHSTSLRQVQHHSIMHVTAVKPIDRWPALLLSSLRRWGGLRGPRHDCQRPARHPGSAAIHARQSEDRWALTLLTARLDDYASFSKVNSHLLNPPTPLKHVPVRIYIPSSPPDPSTSGAASAAPGSFRVMQSLVPPRSANRE